MTSVLSGRTAFHAEMESTSIETDYQEEALGQEVLGVIV